MFKKYKDFSIYYDKNSKEECDKLLSLLKNNYEFFKSILPNKISLKKKVTNHYRIDNLDQYIMKKIHNIKEDDYIKKMKKTPSKQSNLYKDYLYDKSNQEEQDNVHNPYYDLSIASIVYYDKEEDIYNSLKNIKLEEEKLVSFLKENSYSEVINLLLKRSKEKLDYFMPNTLKYLTPIWEDIKKKRRKPEKTDYSYTKMEKEELIKLMEEFLKEIDKEDELLTIFQELRKKNNLILVESQEDVNLNNSTSNGNEIILYCNHNIHDFAVLAHEFGHYIANYQNKEVKSYLFDELPSFYFEEESINYLERIGIKEEEIKYLRNIRKNYNYNAAITSIDLLELMKKEEEKKLNMNEIRDFLKNQHPLNSDEEIDILIDFYVRRMVETDGDIIRLVSYVVADYLMEDYKNMDSYTMKQIIKNIYAMNPEEIIKKKEKTYGKRMQ
ncbi:MAG: hypothetical protein IKE70_04065 [Bacilli bacterium]|nr:hypothetical protein [Bacilli bacterium]